MMSELPLNWQLLMDSDICRLMKEKRRKKRNVLPDGLIGPDALRCTMYCSPVTKKKKRMFNSLS